MKIYYAEHDLYPATYNFKDEVDGTSGTDIDFVDSATLYNGACEIISDWQSHKKVLRLTDDITGGENPSIRHNETQATSGTRELWIGTDDITEAWYFGWYDTVFVVYLRITTNNLYYRDNVNVWQVVQAVSNNIFYHLKVVWRADNTFDLYVDGTKQVDNQITNNNQVSGIQQFRFYAYGNSVDHFYIDAYGDPDNDTDYNIGDNLFTDFHDPYNKEEITGIKTYPIIKPRLDAYFVGSFIVDDFEGSLFTTWNGRDFNIIVIEDDSNNILFRGFLTRKIFKKDSLTISIAGIGVLLDWVHFGSEGSVNYVLEEGLVKAPLSGDSILQCKDLEGANFTWDVDWWVEGGRDVGLLIVDKTAINTRTWDSSAISQTGGTVRGGNNASTTTYKDDDYYAVRESTIQPDKPITIITSVIDGVAVDDTDFLKEIRIEYNFRLNLTAGILAHNWASVNVQILKDTTWVTLPMSASLETLWGAVSSGWVRGIPLDVDGGNGLQHVISGTDTELQKYFDKIGAQYTSLKGLRFVTNGLLATDAYIDVHIDFINVIVGYTTAFDVGPVMETITENTATALTCKDVSAWDEMGVVENDGLKIGQNSRVVIQDIGSQSGLHISRVDNYGNSGATSNTYPNADTTTIEWTTTGGNHYGELDDANDATYVDTAVDAEEDIYDFRDINLRGGYVSSLKIYYRQKCDVIDREVLGISYSIDGGTSWSSVLNTDLTVAWVTINKTWSGLEIYDMSDFQVKLLYTQIFAGSAAYVSELYVVFTINGSSFDKYIARKFRGSYCMEPLRAICKIEGSHWYEDYINNQIVVVKPADFVDSTVDLTEANYAQNWEYEDDCNQIRSFFVFGKSEDEIFAKAEDISVEGYLSKQLIDETITNVADAQEVADAQLALLKTKQPSIKITLDGINADLQLGTTVGLTMARPTVAEVDYPIRMIERSRFGGGIKTIIYCGLGKSTPQEQLANIIRENAFRSHKGLTNRLISP